MIEESPYDAVVIGSGAAGGWAAKELTESGMRVALLEAGPMVSSPPSSISLGLSVRGIGADEEPPLDIASSQPMQARCYAYGPSTRHLFVQDTEHPYSTPTEHPFVWIRGRQIGGRTLTWAGQAYRLSNSELKAASLDGWGEDWPISYSDLAPFYDAVEKFSNVCGERDGIENLPDGVFSSPGPISAGESCFQRAVAQKWSERRIVSARCAMRPGWEQDADRTDYTSRFFSSPNSTITCAVKTRKLTLLPNSIVSKIVVDPSTGLVDRVSCIDRLTHQTREVRARVVVLCASTIESTRILLNSRSPSHPRGLANSSGIVGHYLMDHLMMCFDGRISFPESEESMHQLTEGNGIYMPRFQNLTSPDKRFIRGYGVQVKTIGKTEKLPSRAEKSGTHYASTICFTAFGEPLPRFESKISLNSRLTDTWGIPAPHIEYSRSENDFAMMEAAAGEIRSMAASAGVTLRDERGEFCDPGLAIHEAGTARMGNDPSRSVLNSLNQSWDVKNLFITDAASFPSLGFQNPTLTIMALTVRSCGYIANQWRRGFL